VLKQSQMLGGQKASDHSAAESLESISKTRIWLSVQPE